MTTMQVRKLTRRALDWAVAKAEGWTFGEWHRSDGEWQVWAEKVDAKGRGPAGYFPTDRRFHFSTEWGAGGPIVDKAGILFHGESDGYKYNAWIVGPQYARAGGDTHLEAATRCYVISELGEEIDVPEELL